jgi:hypothetical protein
MQDSNNIETPRLQNNSHLFSFASNIDNSNIKLKQDFPDTSRSMRRKLKNSHIQENSIHLAYNTDSLSNDIEHFRKLTYRDKIVNIFITPRICLTLRIIKVILKRLSVT